MEEIKEVKTEVEVIESNSGISKTSTLILHPRDLAEYSCTVEGGNPLPNLILVVTDQHQNSLPIITTSNISVTVSIPNQIETVLASCFAGNDDGYLQHSKEASVHYPPTDVTVTGPSTIEEEEEVSYICFSAPGNPSAEIEWEVWAANGEPIEFIAENVADDKQIVSHLTLTTTRSHKKINVLCISRNSAGTAEASIATDVIYLPENILLTGPSTLSQTESSSFFCSTDDSHPAVNLRWSVLENLENTKESFSIDSGSVETYET